MPAASQDLRKELNGAEEDGPEHDARIFGEVTDLFLSNVGRLSELAEKVTQIEGQADDLYDSGRKALFETHRQGDPMAFIVGVDIYSHLEKVVDRFEDVANRISGIVIEQV